MEIIRHRVNTSAEADKLPTAFGAEIDIRSRGDELILHHDAFTDGEAFTDFASAWAARGKRGTLILNPKEDGLEKRIVEVLERFRIEPYFFLDLTIPTTVRLAVKENFSHIAVRVSEYESAENALKLAAKVSWAWVDCFAGKPLPRSVFETLRGRFRLCLVSPELQGFPSSQIQEFLPLKPLLDAVCTKHPDLWSAP